MLLLSPSEAWGGCGCGWESKAVLEHSKGTWLLIQNRGLLANMTSSPGLACCPLPQQLSPFQALPDCQAWPVPLLPRLLSCPSRGAPPGSKHLPCWSLFLCFLLTLSAEPCSSLDAELRPNQAPRSMLGFVAPVPSAGCPSLPHHAAGGSPCGPRTDGQMTEGLPRGTLFCYSSFLLPAEEKWLWQWISASGVVAN